MISDSNRLTALRVSKLKTPGRYGDGGGLWLQIGPKGGKSWLFRYTRFGRARAMGLGPVDVLSLADARLKALACRRLLLDGVDPIDARKAERGRAKAEAARVVTFKEAAEAYIDAHKAGWKNPVHKKQWPSTMEAYVYPVFGKLPVGEIDTPLVLKALEPIWTEKPETAGRVRGRIESVLDWAAARGSRSGENPARWRGHLDKLLPARGKVRRVRHHTALPWAELPAFMALLRKEAGSSARALEFTILTAARTGEAIGATWAEIDLRAKLWIVPAERMKADREHRVPLGDRALALLKALPREDGNDFVFLGGKAGAGLSNMALLQRLKRMGRPDLTVHGFRSAFRDWAGETTAFPREVIEAALAHTLKDKTEAAYRRGDALEKRRKLMAAWGAYCSAPPRPAGQVVAIGARAAP